MLTKLKTGQNFSPNNQFWRCKNYKIGVGTRLEVVWMYQTCSWDWIVPSRTCWGRYSRKNEGNSQWRDRDRIYSRRCLLYLARSRRMGIWRWKTYWVWIYSWKQGFWSLDFQIRFEPSILGNWIWDSYNLCWSQIIQWLFCKAVICVSYTNLKRSRLSKIQT